MSSPKLEPRPIDTSPAHEGLFPGPDGWFLSPEGAAVSFKERLAVIADVHLGYEWARGRNGDVVPAHTLSESQAQIGRLLERAAIERLVVAGDLVESPRPCGPTRRDAEELCAWLAQREVELVILRGNHDPARRPPLPDSLVVREWTIAHGHRPVQATRRIIGHHHPALKLGALVTRCFLVAEDLIVLPAFSRNAAGLNVLTNDLAMLRLENPSTLHVLVPVGEDVLDFGPLCGLRVSIQG